MARRFLLRLAPPPEPTSGPAPEPPPAAIGVLETLTAPPLCLRATSEDVLAVAEHCFRKPFAFVGLLAPAVLAAMCKLRVRVAIGTVLLEPMAEWAPDIVSGVVAPAAEPITFAWVEVRTTGVNERVLDLNSDGCIGNHWIPLRGNPPRIARTPHPPCAGIICESVGHPACPPLRRVSRG